jgi:probable rRNA maturation factor
MAESFAGKSLRRMKTVDREKLSGPRYPKSGMRRAVRVFNGHPGLRLDRRAVAAIIHLLDAHAAETLGLPISDRRSPTAASPSSTKFGHGVERSALPGVSNGEISIAFLTGPALAQLHARFLGDPSATDVITFAGAPALRQAPIESGQAGEICISADAARALAQKHGRDFSEELTLYVVHGWLHLAGHDDLQPANKRRMRAAEARALKLLRAAGAIPRFRIA